MKSPIPALRANRYLDYSAAWEKAWFCADGKFDWNLAEEMGRERSDELPFAANQRSEEQPYGGQSAMSRPVPGVVARLELRRPAY